MRKPNSIPDDVWKRMQQHGAEMMARKTVNPVPYDAWSFPERSIPFKMKGKKNCETCQGNGYIWFQPPMTSTVTKKDGTEEVRTFKEPVFGWIRCWTCVAFESAGERRGAGRVVLAV